MMKTHVLVSFLILAACAAPAMAENRQGAVTLTPFYGMLAFSHQAKHLDTDFTAGLRGGYNITRNVSTELLFAYTETVYDPAVIYATVYRYGADMVYNFRPEHPLVPFVAAGLGGITEDYAKERHDQTHLYLGYGFGLKYSLTDWLALRSDFHHSFVLDGLTSNFELSAGLHFQFGGN
ncbi:outer membrane beta-barrel protein [Geobacter sp.]|uniref:outer membrane beta-barrel protein n=1 Tax=Geobacter sp. TaxID=46610 RepID=UPI0027BA87EC|nr:outer membrane beta-barrel protein [Geobacter sp.]